MEAVGVEEETRDDSDGGEMGQMSLDLRSVRRLVDLRLPSVREEKDHELQGHVPHPNWCSVCVRAK